LDWNAGDSGNAQTIVSRCGAMPSTASFGWKGVDITSCLMKDKMAGRNKTQFRIHFTAEPDSDLLLDYVKYNSGDAQSHRPRILIGTSSR
jgi:hypothetical protein